MLVLVELAEVTQRLLAQSGRRYLAIPCVIKKELRLGLSTLAIRNAAASRSAHLLLLRKGSLPLRADPRVEYAQTAHATTARCDSRVWCTASIFSSSLSCVELAEPATTAMRIETDLDGCPSATAMSRGGGLDGVCQARGERGP